ncbi:hypothetical protein [Halodesulfovibrio spirochaetisodalis]|uniref:Uncharacterized protein n=1 Tax=Halodesulfovibrio spirochaetisodalis TaxID=1560234 RepID=A0A1B7XPR3_9BACT|nr:hypothetical protein [Halodesulfovibrio spirochaetisodalis]OBQ57500.1 hypothetical protein SP90_00140 [Halodesulfovibrio spirochaetisodalis]
MVAISSLMNKTMDVTQLQKATKAMQKKVEKQVSVSNLFTNKQTDHSDYIRAANKGANAARQTYESKSSSMISLLQAQMNNESNDGPLDFSYSRRARIGARASQLLRTDMNSTIHRNNDEAAAQESTAVRSRATGASELPRPVPVARVSVNPRVARSAPVKISIRV